MQTSEQKLTPNSSTIKRLIRIDQEIIVEFKYGSYSYTRKGDITEDWNKIKSADSAGKAVHRVLKDKNGSYIAEKINNEAVLKILKYAEFGGGCEKTT